ncbi:MAG: hypothetical protein ABI473_09925 [Candidatus Dormibacter sp.]
MSGQNGKDDHDLDLKGVAEAIRSLREQLSKVAADRERSRSETDAVIERAKKAQQLLESVA